MITQSGRNLMIWQVILWGKVFSMTIFIRILVRINPPSLEENLMTW